MLGENWDLGHTGLSRQDVDRLTCLKLRGAKKKRIPSLHLTQGWQGRRGPPRASTLTLAHGRQGCGNRGRLGLRNYSTRTVTTCHTSAACAACSGGYLSPKAPVPLQTPETSSEGGPAEQRQRLINSRRERGVPPTSLVFVRGV